MRYVASSLVLPAALAVLTAGTLLAAQGPPGPRKPPSALRAVPAETTAAKAKDPAWKAPRTAWGHPDLEGTWTSDDMRGIPTARPPAQAARESLDAGGVCPARGRRRGVARSRGEPGNLPAQRVRCADVRLHVVHRRPGRRPHAGLTPVGLARRKAQAGVGTFGTRPFNGFDDFSLYDRCITRGVGGVFPVLYGNGLLIAQTPNEVVISYEMVHDTRVIPLDGRPRVGPAIKQYMGDSRGRFEGDTLVVETHNFTDKPGFAGVPNSDGLKLTEWFTRIDPQMIDYRIRVEDPATLDAPFTVRFTITQQPGYQLYEYSCHEGNSAVGNALSGERAYEQAVADAKAQGASRFRRVPPAWRSTPAPTSRGASRSARSGSDADPAHIRTCRHARVVRPARAADSAGVRRMLMTRLVWWALVWALVTVPAVAQNQQASLASAVRPATRGFVWTIERQGQTGWLVGSLHLMTPDAYPLPPFLESAFLSAQVLVEEADPDELKAPEAAADLVRRAFYPAGQSLEKHLSAETYRTIVERAAKAGLPAEVVQRMRPWMLAITLAAVEMQSAGFDPALGLDRHFRDRAIALGKPVQTLEASLEQVSMLESLGAAVAGIAGGRDASGHGDGDFPDPDPDGRVEGRGRSYLGEDPPRRHERGAGHLPGALRRSQQALGAQDRSLPGQGAVHGGRGGRAHGRRRRLDRSADQARLPSVPTLARFQKRNGVGCPELWNWGRA